jgi:hypothetical protein
MHCFEGFQFWWHWPKLEGHVLMASTKKCFSFQDRMHDLLDITREFSLGLLCPTGWEACPCKLYDAKFCPVRAKTSGIYGRNIPLSRRPSYSSPRRSTRRMPFPQEKTCDYDLTYDFCAIHKKGMNTRTCRVSLKAPLHDFRHRRDPLVSPKTTAVLNKSKIRQRFRNLYPD